MEQFQASILLKRMRPEAYLEEYSRKNYGEVAALCANNKPEKDKSYFVRCFNKNPYSNGQDTVSDCDALQAKCAASLVTSCETELCHACPVLLGLLFELLINFVAPLHIY